MDSVLYRSDSIITVGDSLQNAVVDVYLTEFRADHDFRFVVQKTVTRKNGIAYIIPDRLSVIKHFQIAWNAPEDSVSESLILLRIVGEEICCFIIIEREQLHMCSDSSI